MKLRNTAIAAALSLMPIGQPLLIGTGAALTTTAVLLSIPEKALADTEKKYIQNAINKYDRNKLEEAILDLDQAIKINPKSDVAYTLRGLIKRELKDFEGAILDFTSGIRINPNDDDSYYFRGEAKLESIDTSNKIATNDQDRVSIVRRDAVSDFDKAISINSKKAKYYRKRGFTKMLLEDYKSALKDFNQVLKLDKSDYAIYRIKGFIKVTLGDIKGACKDLNKPEISRDSLAIKLREEHCGGNISSLKVKYSNNIILSNSYWAKGVKNERSGNYKQAIDDLTRAIELNPNNKRAYNSRAIAKGNSGDIKGAIEDYTKGIEIDPGDPLMYRNRGARKAELKEHKGAISDYDKAIDITPDDYYAYYLRARSKGALGDYSGEISDHSKSLELKKDSFQVYYERAYAKIEIKDFEGAISDLTKAIEINPNFPEAYSLRGYSKGAGLNDNQGACSDFKKSAALGSEFRIKWLQGEQGAWCRIMPD